MQLEPAQIALALLELCLFLTGGVLVLRLLLVREQRGRWLGSSQLARWPVTASDFVLLIATVLLCVVLFPLMARVLFGDFLAAAPDRQGLEIFVYGVAQDGGGLVGWLLFPLLVRTWAPVPDTAPLPAPPVPRLPWTRVLLQGGATLLAAIPVVTLLSLGWLQVLRLVGLPETPQPMIAIFTGTKSPLVLGGMILVACVLGPLFEEFVFRAGIYRYGRQVLGRGWALVISSSLFAALHGNWAGFLPLAVLGAVFALAYEATGDIRVPVIAHSLFNVNSVLIALSGLQQATESVP